jgi:hypothetical protein
MHDSLLPGPARIWSGPPSSATFRCCCNMMRSERGYPNPGGSDRERAA